MKEPEEMPPSDAFERALEAALKRVAPPEGFAQRVLARASPASTQPPHGRSSHFRRVRVVSQSGPWLALAASLLFAVLAFFGEQHHGREIRRREARAKLETSMTITRQTLAGVGIETRKQLSDAGIQLAP